MKIEVRVSKLEEVVQKHLQESGFIQTNLKWNTWITCSIAVAIIAKVVKDFLH